MSNHLVIVPSFVVIVVLALIGATTSSTIPGLSSPPLVNESSASVNSTLNQLECYCDKLFQRTKSAFHQAATFVQTWAYKYAHFWTDKYWKVIDAVGLGNSVVANSTNGSTTVTSTLVRVRMIRAVDDNGTVVTSEAALDQEEDDDGDKQGDSSFESLMNHTALYARVAIRHMQSGLERVADFVGSLLTGWIDRNAAELVVQNGTASSSKPEQTSFVDDGSERVANQIKPEQVPVRKTARYLGPTITVWSNGTSTNGTNVSISVKTNLTGNHKVTQLKKSAGSGPIIFDLEVSGSLQVMNGTGRVALEMFQTGWEPVVQQIASLISKAIWYSVGEGPE